MPEILKTIARYEEFAPSGPLAAFVACWWSFSIPLTARSFEHAVVPDGTLSVVFIRKQRPPRRFLSVLGPRTQALKVPVDSGDSFSGARLLPGASRPLLGIAPAKLRDRVRPLSELAPELANRMLLQLDSAATDRQCFAMMERALAELAHRGETIDRAISEAAATLLRAQGNAKIAGVATGAGLSARQFRRRFYEAVGLTPKEFSRIIRVRCACIHIAAPEKARLAAIAHGTGYADQAHLSREFARVFGSPAGDVSALLRGFEHGEFKESPMSVSFKT